MPRTLSCLRLPCYIPSHYWYAYDHSIAFVSRLFYTQSAASPFPTVLTMSGELRAQRKIDICTVLQSILLRHQESSVTRWYPVSGTTFGCSRGKRCQVRLRIRLIIRLVARSTEGLVVRFGPRSSAGARQCVGLDGLDSLLDKDGLLGDRHPSECVGGQPKTSAGKFGRVMAKVQAPC